MGASKTMSCEDENLASRRRFIQGALGGAAATMMAMDDDIIYGQSQGSALTSLSLSAASQLVRSKKASPVELTKACLSGSNG